MSYLKSLSKYHLKERKKEEKKKKRKKEQNLI
jgi:hypothetical protein